MDAINLEATNGILVESNIINREEILSVKKGAWSSHEDSLLVNYISIHGEGRWNFVARGSGLRRTGKSCRLRWKNYLQPNVRRGNFTLDEQLRIVELQSLYGNRWSKIAKFLPGRTDNEIKNYWRSRIVNRAQKQLKYDTDSVEIREFAREIWFPRLMFEKIHASNNNNYYYYSNNNNINYNIGNGVMMNYDFENKGAAENVGPEAYWANLSEAHQAATLTQNSSMNNIDATSFQLDLEQNKHGLDIFCGNDILNYEELSNVLVDDYLL